ncbi:MAG: fibrobacter succinogenes major paralogous domain-containing protein, partial [Bacteroidia bacterium]|nr:fibrobacter succinogenes major paralogous domain-containing protein [Bacteroidia bacterium]
STPVGAVLFIDGTSVGITPYSGILSFGSHFLKIEQGGKKLEKAITIDQSDGVINFTLSFDSSPTDMDGNVYKTVKIGTQVWMAENLRTTKYNDGTTIPLVSDGTKWSKLTTPGYCFYNDDVANYKKYGALYNWYTVNTGKLAPTGWHIPTQADWTTLENFLIANANNYNRTTAGNRIAKSLAATSYWNSDSGTGAIGNDMVKNNKSGFAALPGGYRLNSGTFYLIGYYGYWWSSTESTITNAWFRHLNYNSYSLYRNNFTKSHGFSVRCIKD